MIARAKAAANKVAEMDDSEKLAFLKRIWFAGFPLPSTMLLTICVLDPKIGRRLLIRVAEGLGIDTGGVTAE
jgi:hypothetical protein